VSIAAIGPARIYTRRMTAQPTERAARPRRGEGSYDERRDRLAESALVTLGERGYANTSLRDIAANSDFSHGVVHYYFRDKTELITYCVRYYKARCVHRYDGVVSESATAEELTAGFAAKLVETVVAEAPMHRLWYDLRTQAMFDDELREAVLVIDGTLEEMIWRILSRLSELSGRALVVDSGTAYAMVDGVFERTLLRHLSGDGSALEALRAAALGLPALVLAPA
jgi:TetR/AcrR family transcriptional regulator, transcriptional repressor of bet genes